MNRAPDTPFAWAREWDGDVSDLDKYVVVFNEDEKDDQEGWFALYTQLPASTEWPVSHATIRPFHPSFDEATSTKENVSQVAPRQGSDLLLPVIDRVREVFAGKISDRGLLYWFFAENGYLEGKRPFELLGTASDAVIEAAKRGAEPLDY